MASRVFMLNTLDREVVACLRGNEGREVTVQFYEDFVNRLREETGRLVRVLGENPAPCIDLDVPSRSMMRIPFGDNSGTYGIAHENQILTIRLAGSDETLYHNPDVLAYRETLRPSKRGNPQSQE